MVEFFGLSGYFSFHSRNMGTSLTVKRVSVPGGKYMSDKKKAPNPIDVHVGARVRLRRSMMGWSQEKLGDNLGVTFQQIQKYEKGANRISASRMQKISEVLNTPVSFFFEDVPGSQNAALGGLAEATSSDYVVDFLSSPDGLQLNQAFAKIRDPKVRKKIVDLVKSLAEEDE